MQKPLIPALLALLMIFASCGKSTDSPDNVDTWTVTYYHEGTTDQVATTDAFKGYTFEFATDDKLNITAPDGKAIVAKWRVQNNNTVFSMGMENPSTPLDKVVGDWTVEEYTATSIKLKGGIDAASTNKLLQFTKQ